MILEELINALESAESIVLEPVCYGQTVPTFRTEPWMFQRAAQGASV